MPKIITTKTHTSGIALGGIGSGGVELLPDGELHYLFNTGKEDKKINCKADKIIFGSKQLSDSEILVKSGDVACVFVKK